MIDFIFRYDYTGYRFMYAIVSYLSSENPQR